MFEMFSKRKSGTGSDPDQVSNTSSTVLEPTSLTQMDQTTNNTVMESVEPKCSFWQSLKWDRRIWDTKEADHVVPDSNYEQRMKMWKEWSQMKEKIRDKNLSPEDVEKYKEMLWQTVYSMYDKSNFESKWSCGWRQKFNWHKTTEEKIGNQQDKELIGSDNNGSVLKLMPSSKLSLLA